MRSAVIADIHSNLEAFQAVLRDLEERGGADEIWCLGDIVGYGPDPRECIRLLRQQHAVCVAGNHDWAAIGKLDTSAFNPEAAAACQWTAEALKKEDVDYLAGLPLTLHVGDFTLAHGSPREPIWEYVLSTQAAKANFGCLRLQILPHRPFPLAPVVRARCQELLPAAPTAGRALAEDREPLHHQLRQCGTAKGRRPEGQLRHHRHGDGDPLASPRQV